MLHRWPSTRSFFASMCLPHPTRRDDVSEWVCCFTHPPSCGTCVFVFVVLLKVSFFSGLPSGRHPLLPCFMPCLCRRIVNPPRCGSPFTSNFSGIAVGLLVGMLSINRPFFLRMSLCLIRALPCHLDVYLSPNAYTETFSFSWPLSRSTCM
uniref:Uncharacterized protein n=1 Tax=Trypanosoma vivax (strain Y486) TaxID=1055687 RepID=G0UAX0_TRYVY|nr:hypothetical protein TVY486_1104410 [Trypanosoma vivax Y486]